jgi:hypothetical protein
MINAAVKDREKDKSGVKVDYIKVARVVGQHEAYNALFGPNVPQAKDKACRWCNDRMHTIRLMLIVAPNWRQN